MNKRRNRDHRVRLAKHLHTFKVQGKGKWAVLYRKPGEKSVKLYYDVAKPTENAIRELYFTHILQGEPLPAPLQRGAEGTWNAACDIYERDGVTQLKRPGQVLAAIKYLRSDDGFSRQNSTLSTRYARIFANRYGRNGPLQINTLPKRSQTEKLA
jgi:hypothetical protein